MRNIASRLFIVFFIGLWLVWSYYAVFYDPYTDYKKRKIDHNQEQIEQISNELDSIRMIVNNRSKCL